MILFCVNLIQDNIIGLRGKVQKMEYKKKLNDEDIKIIKKFISKKNMDYKSRDFKEIIDYRIDFEDNIYILFDNGVLYKNDELYDVDIKNLFSLDIYRIYEITKENRINPIDEGYCYDIDYYLNNNNGSYKKIIVDYLYLIALTEEGRIIAVSTNPVGLGVVPENFVDVEDIFFKEYENTVEPHIVKEGIEKPLYVS